MTDYADILAAASYRLPGASAGAITLEMKLLLNEFCDASNAWIEPAALTTVNGIITYNVTTTDGIPNRLMNIVDGSGGVYRGWMSPPGTLGSSTYTVSLGSVPSTSMLLTANIALVPDSSLADPSVSVPAWLLNQYHNGLLDGLLARMMSQIAKPYTNQQMAKTHYMLFRQTAQKAKNDMLHRFSFRGTGWRYPRGFR